MNAVRREGASQRSADLDDRQLLMLLLLPVVMLATALAVSQAHRMPLRLAPMLEAALPPIPTLPRSLPFDALAMVRPVETPRLTYAPIQPEIPTVDAQIAALAPLTLPTVAPSIPLEIAAAKPGDTTVSTAASIAIDLMIAGLPPLGYPVASPFLAPPAAIPSLVLPDLAYARPLPIFPLPADPDVGNRCIAKLPLPGPRSSGRLAATPASDFGLHLAAAARSQMDDLVIYTARYQRIAYPMGDVPPLHGACTDVVIRAYRALGLDLQALVQQSGLGSGDPSIDHRRTETLRRFFSRHGESLTISEFPEDYKPGDIVTYYRPFSRVSRAHIAVVSDVISPTRKPMIIHNRGWGTQLEDALFVDKITGHYRFEGAALLSAGGVSRRNQGKVAPTAGAGEKPPVAVIRTGAQESRIAAARGLQNRTRPAATPAD